ncbi:hypothetical protein [Pseudomonas botevensis]|uniref:hypothetical protein n=1 Tax=Pseudomonas botevensis TaxID=2842352 RepID=UPI001C3C972B|nr:hypothetical protein [Pseudomonas botevensis]MBV4476056.1 hypothetical protein [Pseudomonas botevensis]
MESPKKSFKANLFYKGKPLVLNYQLMEARLKRKRLTPAQRAEYNRQLQNEGGFLTVADREDTEPLLINFHSEEERYTLRVATPGMFLGKLLSMENIRDGQGQQTFEKQWVVVDRTEPTRFFLESVSPGTVRMLNVAKKASSDNEIKGPIYLYEQPGRLELDNQRYFSQTRIEGQHLLHDPFGVNFDIQVKDVPLSNDPSD